jgi:hypothetical protein
MRFHLGNFNDEGVAIRNATVHSEVLAEDDGFGGANSKAIYKAAIRWTLSKQEHVDRRWPANWMDLSVTELANRLILQDEET